MTYIYHKVRHDFGVFIAQLVSLEAERKSTVLIKL